MKWTNEQQRAIDERGKNILVAAAAGSGKTAVLVERIKKLIIEDGVGIDHMLIVTFTNAAAAEMKEKIRKALLAEIDERPEHAPKMREQLALLSRANISTFHAFALEVIRKFFYEADVEPGFSICDDAQRTILKEDALDLLLEQWFAKDDEDFYEFLGWYSSDRNQNKIRTMLDQTYNTLMAMTHPWTWLDAKIEELKMSPEVFATSDGMAYIWKLIVDLLEKTCHYQEKAVELLDGQGLERLAQKVDQEELVFYHQMLDFAENRDWLALEDAIKAFKATRLVAKKDEKESYEEVKPTVAALRKRASSGVGEIKSMFFTVPLAEQIEEMNQTAPKAELLRELLLDFDHIFRLAKEEKRLVDFNDIEHFCLEILEAGEAARYYQNKFDHIFIDEYQDTNILQEEIIGLIKRDNNLFMVGDIKQSIYKFRLAEPEIFKDKYVRYQEEEQSTKIDLNQNFRSKSAILREINEIFDDVMDDYDEAAMLYPGVDYDGPFNYTPQLKVVDAATVDAADEELATLKNTELEALEVARLIKQNLGKPFFDHKKGVERTLGLRDMVVLMRGTKNYADIFYQTLKESGIDSFVDESDGYFDTMEIGVFMNLLSIIDNKQQDVPLISVLHSEIFKFSSLELGRIRAEYKKGSFAKALMSYAEGGSRAGLRAKCEATLASLEKWKSQSLSQPLSGFIWSLLLETGYYMEIGAMPGGSQRQANLRALVDKAESYMQDRQTSLYSFVRYIDAVKTRKVPMGQVKLVGEQDDLVRIMTIHKSKGLEFPLVIVSGMGRRLNYTKLGSGVAVHKDIGIGMTLADFNGHWYKQTLLQKLIARQVHQEEVQEETRILYVALTRAKDFLYMTGTVKDGEKYRENLEIAMGSDTTYLDMIGETTSWEMIDANLLSPSKGENRRFKGNPLTDDIFVAKPSASTKSDVLARLDYVYPYEKARMMKSKYSVTEINQMAYEGTGGAGGGLKTTLAVPKFRQGERKLTAAEKGTIYHSIMERIDFGRAAREGIDYVKEEVQSMIACELLSAEEADVVQLEKITDFFETDLGRRCSEAFDAGRVERERTFDLLVELDGEEVIVQGIIDCYVEEDDGILLLDYKTNWIDTAKPVEEEAARLKAAYTRQIDIYRQAMECTLEKPVKEAYLYLFSAGIKVEM